MKNCQNGHPGQTVKQKKGLYHFYCFAYFEISKSQEQIYLPNSDSGRCFKAQRQLLNIVNGYHNNHQELWNKYPGVELNSIQLWSYPSREVLNRYAYTCVTLAPWPGCCMISLAFLLICSFTITIWDFILMLGNFKFQMGNDSQPEGLRLEGNAYVF